jgi:hypothetical protein
MTPLYCPVTVSGSYASGSYAGDGTDCVHNGVTSYSTTYLDVATLVAGNQSDGTFTPGGSLAVAWRPDRQVYYSPGNTGAWYGSGDWDILTCNMCCCTAGHEPVFRYSVRLPREHWFWQEPEEEIPPAQVDEIRMQAMSAPVDVPAGPQKTNLGDEQPVVFAGHVLTESGSESESGQCRSILYAPSENDNAVFRAAVSAACGNALVDYFDARVATPSVALMSGYDCVLTWANYAYSNNVQFGDNLADYVDAGGTVVLGQWCYQSDQVNWLAGRIMTAAYCPVTVSTSYDTGSYNGDGTDCVHNGVTAYSTDYLDRATLVAGNLSDGTFNNPSNSLAVAWRPDRRVYYSPGNTGATFGSGDWDILTCNECCCGAVGNIYWFSVVAVYDACEPDYPWGWTNHEYYFEDDAVAGYPDVGGTWRWEELYDQTEQSEDMSFILFTDPDPILGTCWDPLECGGQPTGDATCNGSVDLADLFALKAAWGMVGPYTSPFCCADFTQNNSVDLADLFALKAGWGVTGHSPATGSQKCP